MRRLPLLLTALALAAGLTALGGVDRPEAGHRAPALTPPQPTDAATATDPLSRAIAADRQRLRRRPEDASTLARLGTEYVEQARLTADSGLYPRAEQALRSSLALTPQGNVEALTGLGALANARHLFDQARDHAEQAIAANPAHWPAYAVLADARTQLGDDTGATEAVQQLLDRRPGTASFTRAAYEFEQHGRPDEARSALGQALTSAQSPADRAFCRHQIAELDWNAGHFEEALTGYRQALTDDPAHTPALAGQARAEAALGRTEEAVRDYTAAIARVPLPQYLLELGELREATGHRAEAEEQYRVLAAEQRLAAANGVNDDLALGQYETDHGDPARAVALLRAEWSRRQHVLVADALAWALHRTGADEEALGLAERSLRLGWHHALFDFHLGEIERSLGHPDRARTHLARALATNPAFHPLHAATARADLASLSR
ncbi:tetratricopeptide repeat protein [Kitasatospora sp. NPDC096147]|uniref:tetratricopeptide repeat protein n=1 Tax=Kitasatospora sp. NPDC096147 TaxID=3364093 RepID=UPI00382A30FB